MPSLFVNCPTVICSPNICYGRDTTSELWTPVLFYTSEIQSTAIVLYCSLQTIIIFHTIHLILCLQQAGEIDNLTVSLGQSTLVVLCRFHVGAGIPGVAPHYISPPSTFNVLLGSYWFDKPWFHTEGKLAAVRITPSSWGSQRTCVYTLSPCSWRRHQLLFVEYHVSCYACSSCLK